MVLSSETVSFHQAAASFVIPDSFGEGICSEDY